MISTVDPDAWHTQPGRVQAHIVIDPDSGLTTAVRVTKASGPENSDAAVGANLVGEDITITHDADADDVEVLGDSAYGTGDMLHALHTRNWTPVIKPWPLRSPVPGGFTIDDFHDIAAGAVACPAGVTRLVSAKRTVTFGAACRGCPLREQCTASASGRSLHEHDHLQREHRTRSAEEV